jgi:flagellar hook-associated protein 3 FlgL
MRTDPFYSSTLSQSLSSLTGQQNTLSAELSSGLRVSSADIDPTAAAQSVKLGSAIAADDAYVSAASTVESRLQAGDSALGSVVTQITSAISLAVEGSNGTLTSSQVQAVGQQIAAVRDQVMTLANSSYAGSYLFSGSDAGVEPFTLNTSTTPAVTTYNGDSGHQTLQSPQGQAMQVSMPGQSIFTLGGADVLNTLNKLVADFSTGSVSSSTADDITTLRAGLDNVSLQRSVMGYAMTEVTTASTYASTQATTYQAAQSNLVAADMAGVATSLSTSETQQKALDSVLSSTNGSNLFSYMSR